MAYPATFDIQPPQQFDKMQILLRVVILIALSIFQVTSFVFGGAYLAFPIIAAVMISQKGPEKYLAEAEQGPTRWLRFLLMFYSYMALATDKLSTEKPEDVVQFNVRPTGKPSVGQALLRIILAIPHAIVLGIIGIVFFFVWLIAAVSILINGTSPDWAENFIRGYLRWNARVLAYMASLVDEYPPFSFENGGAGMPASPAAGAPPAPPAAAPSAAAPSAPAPDAPPAPTPDAPGDGGGGGDGH
ncbi:MAG: DUF4389 domain-containing protein [Dehalococcoidia bacterium]